MNPKYLAPRGTIWVCAVCGKSGYDRTTIGDEACFLKAVLCEDNKILPWKAIEGVSRWPNVDELKKIGYLLDARAQGGAHAIPTPPAENRGGGHA